MYHKNGILLYTRDLGIEPETHDEGLFMWSRISSLTAPNRKRCLANLQLLTAHFDNNRYKERVGSAACFALLAVNSICGSVLCMVQVRIWFHPIFSLMFYG